MSHHYVQEFIRKGKNARHPAVQRIKEMRLADETGYVDFPSPPQSNRPEIPYRVWRLRCIKNGVTKEFVDEGYVNKDGSGAGVGRNQLQNVCLRVDDDDNAVFFLDASPEERGVARIDTIRIPVMDERIARAMQENCADREERKAEARKVAQAMKEANKKKLAGAFAQLSEAVDRDAPPAESSDL